MIHPNINKNEEEDLHFYYLLKKLDFDAIKIGLFFIFTSSQVSRISSAKMKNIKLNFSAMEFHQFKGN